MWMPSHLISLSVNVELWLIGSSRLKHCIWSHIGLQCLLQVGHLSNVQTALKGQWNEDWLSVLQGQQAGAWIVPGKLEPVVSPTIRDGGRELGAGAIFAIPVSYGFPIKVRIYFDFDRKRKGKIDSQLQQGFRIFYYHLLHEDLLNVGLEC